MPYLKSHRRRRNSGAPSLTRTINRRWADAWSRIPEGVGATSAFACLLLIGVALVAKGGGRNFVPGLITGGFGVSGIVWQIAGWWSRRMRTNQLEQDAEVKLERRGRRRTREIREQEAYRKQAAIDASARERAKEAYAARKAEAADSAASDQQLRNTRDNAIARDAMRILTLSDGALLQTARELFEARGFEVVQDGESMRYELLLQDEEGDVHIVARMIPEGRKAEVSDVNALEARRADLDAASAILFGVAGFNPAAVRRASTLPVTLAEPYLLAQWRHMEKLGGRMVVEEKKRKVRNRK